MWNQRVAQPVDQPGPIGLAEENDRIRLGLERLNQCDDLKEFIERAKTAGKADEGAGVFHEHHFAGVKIVKIQRDRLISVRFLLLRQRDVAADGNSARLERPFVRRFHDPRAAAGDHAKAIVRQQPRCLFRRLVIPIARLGSGRAENGHRATDARHRLKPFHELRHDPKNPPTVLTIHRRPRIGNFRPIDGQPRLALGPAILAIVF